MSLLVTNVISVQASSSLATSSPPPSNAVVSPTSSSLSTGHQITSSDVNDSSFQQISKSVEENIRQAQQDPPSPVAHEVASATPASQTLSQKRSENVVHQQLEALIKICEKLSDPNRASEEDLLNLSWGIASLPKNKKFSPKWIDVIHKHDWVILEDISRQIKQLNGSKNREFVREFSPDAAKLKVLLQILSSMEIGNQIPPPKEPCKLPALQKFFYNDFDNFILNQIERNIEIIQASSSSKNPEAWLIEDDSHVKALFRTIVVIGEASKIISENTRKHIPSLSFVGEEQQNLWGVLRDGLYHEKKNRCWKIAKLAPDMWAEVVKELFPAVLQEIKSFKANTPTIHATNKLEALKAICKLSADVHCVDIIRLWREIRTDFAQDPTKLKRTLFGLDTFDNDDFLKVWEDHARPFLKLGVDEQKNKTAVLELLRLRTGILLYEQDINDLTYSADPVDKTAVLIEMKRLLNSINTDNTNQTAESFNRLVDKLVFLLEKEIKTKTGTLILIERDCGKNKKIKDLMSEKIRHLRPFQFSEDFFKDPNGTLNEFGKLREYYIRLKKYSLDKLIDSMKKALKDIKESWPNDVTNEAEIKELIESQKAKRDAEREQEKEQQKKLDPKLSAQGQKKKLDARTSFVQDFIKIYPNGEENSEGEWLFLTFRDKPNPKLSDCLPKLKFFNPETLKHQPTAKEDCFSAIEDLSIFLNQIDCPEIHVRKVTERQFSEISGICAAKSNDSSVLKDQIKKVEGIFNLFAFKDTADFNKDLLAAGIPHPFTEDTKPLKSLRELVISSLKANDNTDFETKLHALVQDAENELSTCFVQKALRCNRIHPRFKAYENVDLLEYVYTSGLEKTSSEYKAKKDAWDKKIKHKIHAPHANAVEVDKTDNTLISFQHKIEKLGNVMLPILDIEQQSHPDETKKNLLLLATEYDLQDIGDLAQRITARPMVWNQGRHLLSSRHLLWMSLMRKMMAHYPLSLSPEVVRWNLEYLAFDTKNVLAKNNNADSCDIEQKLPHERKAISIKELVPKLSGINMYLDHLNLKTDESEILYPPLATANLPYLHPFGEFAIMVYPAKKINKMEFTHNVMSLELILNHELDTKVTVIGNWDKGNNELVNVPSENHIPKDYLNKILQQKQQAHNWIAAQQRYDLYTSDNWTEILFKSGKKVGRNDRDLHNELVFFLDTLKIPKDPDGLIKFTQKSEQRLTNYISNILEELLSKTKAENYPESTLYRWICCLFERFCPPGVAPVSQICIPAAFDEKRPNITINDKSGNALRFLPKKMDGNDERVKPYYKTNDERRDVYNGISLLDNPTKSSVSIPILKELAKYAAQILKAHNQFVLEKLSSEYSLQLSNFSDIEKIVMDDSTLAGAPTTVENIDPETQRLIKQEASALAPKMLDFIKKFKNTPGKEFCKIMLEVIKVDTEIASVARDYFEKNRMDLMEPYIKMDRESKQFFNKMHISSNERWWRKFPFVTSFTKFLDWISSETESLQFDKNGEVIGDFSQNFNELVTDEQVRKDLLLLTKKSKKYWNMANETGLKWARDDIILFGDFDGTFEEIYNEFKKLKKWPNLFLMVTSSSIFDVLLDYLTDISNKAAALDKLQKELGRDFEMQYKFPSSVKGYAARYYNREVELYDARTYFEGKFDTNEVNQRFDNISMMQNTSYKRKFIKNWKETYGEAFKPITSTNPIIEAKSYISYLINTGTLPDCNFDKVGSYSDFWTFVKENDVNVSSITGISGIIKSERLYLQNGGDLKDIPWYQENCANKKNKRSCNLLKAYISFYPIECNFSNSSQKLKSQIEVYNKINEEMKNRQDPENQFETAQYQKKLKKAEYLIKEVCIELEDTLNKIVKTDFFNMIVLSIVLQNMTDNKNELSNDEQISKALQFFIKNVSELTPEDINHAFQIIGNPPSTQLALCI